MKKFLYILFLSLLLCNNGLAKKNISRSKFFNTIEEKGNTGFVLRYHNEKSPSKYEIILPKNSPPIISDYHSRYGVLGGSRSNPKKHGGVDFYQKPGEKIIAAADGKVYGIKIKDKCVGNQFAIFFGKAPLLILLKIEPIFGTLDIAPRTFPLIMNTLLSPLLISDKNFWHII